jgi:Arylsulfotransferase (ASST)
MHPGSPITRRTLLGRAGATALGLATAGGLAELVLDATAGRLPGPPLVPSWRSRPDLKIPSLTVTRSEAAASREPLFFAPYNAPNEAQAGAVIADADGEPMWEQPIAGKVTANFQVQSYRGEPVLTWWEGIIELGHGVGEYVIADSSYRVIRRVQARNRLRGDLHEFVITPQDTALLTSYVVTKSDLSSVGGSRAGTIQDAIFQEVDLATDELLMEWHSLGSVPLEDSYAPVTADWDFFHINSVDLDWDGNLLVSSRSMQTIFKIERSGGIMWRLGGKRSDFQLGPGARFAWQHDARRRADGTLTVFDNGATPAVERRSRALILGVDEAALKAELVSQYSHPGVLAGSQGSVQLLPNGNVFVGWGEVPRVTEFDRAGRIVFDALLGASYQSYRAFRSEWSGTPAEAPATALRLGRDRATVYASWNGATGVHSWRLLGGADQNSMQPLCTTVATGFETALGAVCGACLFGACALDASGGLLGQSAPLSLPA